MSSSSPFDYVKSINKKEPLTDDQLGQIDTSYVPFLTNRAFSNFMDSLTASEFMNRYSPYLTNKMQYDFYYTLLEARNRFGGSWKKNSHSDLVLEASKIENISYKHVKEYVNLLTDDQIEALKASYDKGGK